MRAGFPRVPATSKGVVCPEENGVSEAYPESFPPPTQRFSRLWWFSYQEHFPGHRFRAPPGSGLACSDRMPARARDRGSQTPSPRTRSRATATPRKMGETGSRSRSPAMKAGSAMKAMKVASGCAARSGGVARRVGAATDNYVFNWIV